MNNYFARTYVSEIDGKWYAYGASVEKYSVYAIGNDSRFAPGLYFARWTDAGIKYVSSPSANKRAAIEKARRAGNYSGIV